MEALTPFISAALGALKSALPAPPAPAAPAPVVATTTIPQASVASLGLKILLEPSAGGVLFRAARYVADAEWSLRPRRSWWFPLLEVQFSPA